MSNNNNPNTQLPVEYNPGVCSHKRPNGFTAWQMQSESSGSGPDFDEHVTICVCVLCGDFNISGRKWDSKTQQTNRFSETFHVYVPEAIDAIVKQANFYNEEAKWERIDKAGETAYATKLHQVEQATEDKIEKALHAERNSIQAKVTASETEWAKKVNELRQENEQLRQWKMEAAELLTKIHSYAHKHMEIKLGESIVDFVIARAKERDEFKSENDKLKQQATGWRPLLEEFISMHETGLLPNRFTYEKAKKFLYGE